MTLDTTTLFAAIMIVLWTMAVALAVAGHGRRQDAYWRSWVVANLVLGVAVAVYTFDWQLPPLAALTLPNCLLIYGFSLRWRAAREFSHRAAPAWLVWMPALAFLAIGAPSVFISYAPAFVLSNGILAALAMATAWEFWRDRHDGLPSRYALVAAYGAIGASFAWRVAQSLFETASLPPYLPQDTALVIHLIVGVLYAVASSAFALSLAYERTNAALRYTATHDALTGLLNRGAFEAALHEALNKVPHRPFALAVFDIDHFKQVNDRYGHAAGDEALRVCARVCIEETDHTSLVARIGGEEFAIILHDVGPEQACREVERIRRAVAAQLVTVGPERLRLTVSGGVCHSNAAPKDFDTLMRVADAGLYKAKNKGRNRIENIAA